MDIADVAVSDLSSYDSLIVGAPTWHTGADEGRSGTAWDEAYGDIRSLDLSGKKVAVFGVGDSSAYGEYFARSKNFTRLSERLAKCAVETSLKMTTISPTARLLLMVCLLVSLLMKTMKVTRVKNVQRTGASSSPTQLQIAKASYCMSFNNRVQLIAGSETDLTTASSTWCPTEIQNSSNLYLTEARNEISFTSVAIAPIFIRAH